MFYCFTSEFLIYYYTFYLRCPECSLYISNRDNLKRHYKRIHDRLTCKKCNETFIKKYQLKIHMTTQHLVSYKCNECNKNFTNLTKFKRHESTHKKSDKQYSCNMPECNEVFKKWLLLCAHIKTQHVLGKYLLLYFLYIIFYI